MMSRCLVRGCRNDRGRADSSVTFHPFPTEQKAAKRWASLCGVSGQECSQLLKDLEHGGTGRYQLCSLHFEQKAFEKNPDGKTFSVKLVEGAEPTLFLSPAQTDENNAQVNASLPATDSPRRPAPPSASSCSSCTCAQSVPQSSKAAQAPDCGKSSDVRFTAAEPRPQVSHCGTGTTVVSPQPGVNQIVLNFCDQGKGLTLDNVSSESVPQFPGACHCPQKVVKQVVLIFLDQPRESVPPTLSQESPRTLSSSTQTEWRDGKSETKVHPERPIHLPSSPQQILHQEASTQTSTCMEVSCSQQNCDIQDSHEPMESSSNNNEVSSSPGECLSAFKSGEPDRQALQSQQELIQSTQNDVAGGKADLNDVIPISVKIQPAPESLDKELEHGPCMVPTSSAESQTPLTDNQEPRHIGKCEQRPENPPQSPRCPHSQQTSRQFCLNPSIDQCVGDLLEQCHLASPCVPPCVSSSQCPCISAKRCVKQIVLNFVEKESTSVNQEVPTPCTSRDLSHPVVTSQQHQETQTCDNFLQRTPQRAKEKLKGLQSPPRPAKSRSCPPVPNAHTMLLVSQEEESSSNHPINNGVLPRDISSSLENKVTFEDVAIYFCKEEWELLGATEKNLYREVMSDNYQSLISLGLLKEKPDLVLRIDNEEENLWVNQESHTRIRHHAEDLFLLDQDMDGVSMLAKDDDALPCTGRESAESSSHLGALMRLVNEIPGFLLGSSVTDGSCSPACSTEDHGNSRPSLEVKTEEPSPACSPASAHVPLSKTPEVADSLGMHKSAEQSSNKILTKAEKKLCVTQSLKYSTPVRHPSVSSSCIKSDSGTSGESVQGRLQIKQEELPAAYSPAHNLGQQKEIPSVKSIISHLPKTPLYSPGTRDHLIPDYARRPCSGGGSSLSHSTSASPRNPSVSPVSPNRGTNLGEFKIKIKQEDSGSERDLMESPIYGRKVYHTPSSSSASLQVERVHWKLASSPLRSPADAPLGSSPLHRLVNCLKEITTSRPRPYSNTLSTTRWGADMSRVCSEASIRANSSREPMIPVPEPNPFTVAVTNGAAQLRGIEPKTSDNQNTRASREASPMSSVPLSALGKCLEKIHTRGVSHGSEEPRRGELGMKRTHSDDLSCRSGVFGSAKRPAMEVSSNSRLVSSCSPSHRDLWRPPEELPRVPSEDQPIGNSHLMSVMNCVRKIPAFRPSPSIHVTSTSDTGRICTQGILSEAKNIKVKQEKDEKPPLEAFRQWIQPPQSPDVPKPSGHLAANVHLTGLMKLMEEIPCAESSNPSRAMYSIAVGHSLAQRMDRSNYLFCNEDSNFQAELNDNTIASVDSVYSDDTSWSSENVDPSYSAIGGLQRVVSEFAELGSVSPLVAVAAPPVSSVQDGIVLKKPKEALTASASRLNESVRRSPRDAVRIAASACSAENGEAAIAALRGLQKVVHGFVEQECVSPITAVRNTPPNTNLRDIPGKKTCPEEEAAPPHLQGSSPAPISHFLCDTGKWLSEADSSYSALSGLQKVVNGFSEMSCISPFSAVSTPVSEGPMDVSTQRRSDVQVQDCGSSSLSGQKNVINGVPDASCLSPFMAASNVSSESDAGPTMKSRCERSDEDEMSQKCSLERQKPATITLPNRNDSEYSRTSSSSHCIDLTQEEEAAISSKTRTALLEKETKQKNQEGPSLGRPAELPSSWPKSPVGNRSRFQGSSRTPCNQLIDLTVEDETLTKPKVSSTEVTRKPSHTGITLNPPLAEKHRHSINLPKATSGKLDKPLDPGASGSSRGGVPAVNEHLSGLEKLLKGVPTFTPANRPSGQAWGGSWWFKNAPSHET
ncbi:uncharacterized protein [Eleutherodactylus coqui]|uniref:uncharacterized protein isoform X3 n=1 Tax=Eleutherodactylus coqui TaxID=57060 RepID=UPI0034624747